MDELNDYEKWVEGINQISKFVFEYYKALLESGFEPQEAILLTVEFQKSVIFQLFQKQTGE